MARAPASLAERTAELLRRHRLSITEAADRVGVDYVTVWKMTKGRRVSVETLTRFARAFGEDPVEWVAVGRPELAAAVRQSERAGEEPAEYVPRELPPSVELPLVGYVTETGLVEQAPDHTTVCIPLLEGPVPTHALEVRAYGLWPTLAHGDLLAYREGSGGLYPGDAVVVEIRDGRRRRHQLARYLRTEGEQLVLAPVNAPESAPGAPIRAQIVGIVISLHRTWKREEP